MKLKTALFTAAATLAIVPAAHANGSGLYGAIGAGLSYLEDDLDIDDGIRPGGVFDSEQNTDNGIGVYAALGKYFGDDWRGEFELSYRNNDARSWAADVPNISAFPEGTMSGDISSYAFMLNVIRDFGFIGDWVTPYVGGGVGLAHIDTEITAVRTLGLNGINNITIDDSSRVLAYQGIAGLAFRLAEGLALDLSYRYFGTRNHEVSGAFNTGPFQYEAGYASHSAFAGLRWDFGGAPGPQYKDCWDGSSVPMSSECPPQLQEGSGAAAEPMAIIVYFDYDKSNLTPEAEALIRETAARALANNVDSVKVEGNADRSGGSAYNQALSQRRANVVRDALIANGIPADRIDVAALGEDNPAKPTPDGVREPLNRRTEVRITFN
jgi:outer membrane protein OmpA-like peptidoglycan-associated protein